MTDDLPISSITIRDRSRRELRNIDALAASIHEVGLLNPPTVRCVDDTWVLVAGQRRLAAMGKLGWVTTPVTIAASIEDELTALYAERDENTQRDDFSPAEMVVHARRIEELEKRLANQRLQEGQARGRATRYGHELDCADSAPSSLEPEHHRKTRHKVAKAAGTSHDTLFKARHVIDTAEDPDTPPEVAEVAKRAAANLAARPACPQSPPAGSHASVSLSRPVGYSVRRTHLPCLLNAGESPRRRSSR